MSHARAGAGKNTRNVAVLCIRYLRESSYCRFQVRAHYLFDPTDFGMFDQLAKIELFACLIEIQCFQHDVPLACHKREASSRRVVWHLRHKRANSNNFRPISLFCQNAKDFT